MPLILSLSLSSSAQLLEPFRINHDIQLMSSGGGGIIVGPGGSGFGGAGLETAFLVISVALNIVTNH